MGRKEEFPCDLPSATQEEKKIRLFLKISGHFTGTRCGLKLGPECKLYGSGPRNSVSGADLSRVLQGNYVPTQKCCVEMLIIPYYGNMNLLDPEGLICALGDNCVLVNFISFV